MLTHIAFPSFSVELDDGFGRPPFRFPELDVEIDSQLVNSADEAEQKASTEGQIGGEDSTETTMAAVVTMHIRSEQHLASQEKGESVQEGEDDAPAVKLSIDVIAIFECHEGFSDCQQALEQFIQADTPRSLMWPYVRAFIANVVPHTGLPEFHLPLTQVNTRIDETEALEEKAEE